MKRVLVGLIFLIVCFLFPVTAIAASQSNFMVGSTSYTVDGQPYSMDAMPFIANGRTFLPVRYLAQACGVSSENILFDNNKITIINGDKVIQVSINSKQLVVNGITISMDVAPIVNNGRTYLPARWLAEALGYTVGWDKNKQTVLVYPPGQGTNKAELQSNISQPINQSTTELSVKEIVQKTRKSVLFIQLFDEKNQIIATGSGVAVGNEEILTNYHVIAGCKRATATDDTGLVYEVRGVLAYDQQFDLALLQITGQLTPALCGNSDQVEVGDKVVAIGSPRGLQNTVSEGIVSGLRQIEGNNYIQTTAPISPGSSGGGLFNYKGELIGLTTASLTESQNINIAVPVNSAAALLAQRNATPQPFPSLNINNSTPAATKECNINDVLYALRSRCGQFQTSVDLIRFSYTEGSNDPNYKYTIWAIIDPIDFMLWPCVSETERHNIIEQMLDTAIPAGGDQTLWIILFYQDYWTVYPSSFKSDEIQMVWNGYEWVWLVTHVIGKGMFDGSMLHWSAYI